MLKLAVVAKVAALAYMCWPMKTHGTVQRLSEFAVIIPGELSVEQSLGGHSVGVGHSGQVTMLAIVLCVIPSVYLYVFSCQLPIH